jgi:endonuclease G
MAGATVMMFWATTKVSIATTEQVGVSKQLQAIDSLLLAYEESELRFALRVDSVRVVCDSVPDSVVILSWWRNISKKPVFNVLFVPQVHWTPGQGSEPLDGWPLRWLCEDEKGVLRVYQMYPSDSVMYPRTLPKSDAFSRPDSFQFYVWTRAYWKTPRGDGYATAWESGFSPRTGSVNGLKPLTPKGRHYSESEISEAESWVKYTGYVLRYNESFEQADRVEYSLTAEQVKNLVSEVRYDFRSDPYVGTKSAAPEDYENSGYVEGQLCPVHHMKWSPLATWESFYMSNVSPQKPQFNQGIWTNLENQMEKWAEEYGLIWIVSGPVLNERARYKPIGKDSVAVPEYFYAAVLDYKGPYTENKAKGIGFILPNERSNRPLSAFAVSIDSVEAIVVDSFFTEDAPPYTIGLPVDVAKRVKSSLNVDQWSLR